MPTDSFLKNTESLLESIENESFLKIMIPVIRARTQLHHSRLFESYDSCETCLDYSILFGGNDYCCRKIETEEQFEIVKNQFVEHFNECHHEKAKKEKPVKSYKKIEYLMSTNITSTFRDMFLNGTISYYDAIFERPDTYIRSNEARFIPSSLSATVASYRRTNTRERWLCPRNARHIRTKLTCNNCREDLVVYHLPRQNLESILCENC